MNHEFNETISGRADLNGHAQRTAHAPIDVIKVSAQSRTSVFGVVPLRELPEPLPASCVNTEGRRFKPLALAQSTRRSRRWPLRAAICCWMASTSSSFRRSRMSTSTEPSALRFDSRSNPDNGHRLFQTQQTPAPPGSVAL